MASISHYTIFPILITSIARYYPKYFLYNKDVFDGLNKKTWFKPVFDTFINAKNLTLILKHTIITNIYVFRLDMILGKAGSKKADVYESKISLASRIVKVERQVI